MEKTMSRLKEKYYQEVVPQLQKEFGYKNPMQVPKMVKIIVNAGLGEAIQNAKILEGAVRDIAAITGQKPMVTRAKKSIAGFKLRAGMAIGCKVTLRDNRMYEFFDRLTNIALPRVRDFRGVSANAFDGRGNYSLGIREHIIFPEVNYDQIEKVIGLGIVIVTTAENDEVGRELLRLLGMPFRN